jgi:hypothetical protein
MQLVGFAVNHQRMARIVPALEPDNDIGAAGQPVDNLALTLVTPLGPDNSHIRHDEKYTPRGLLETAPI